VEKQTKPKQTKPKQTKPKQKTVVQYHCKRCGFFWYPGNLNDDNPPEPLQCKNCKNPNWQTSKPIPAYVKVKK